MNMSVCIGLGCFLCTSVFTKNIPYLNIYCPLWYSVKTLLSVELDSVELNIRKIFIGVGSTIHSCTYIHTTQDLAPQG
jgi:hypothetical protein